MFVADGYAEWIKVLDKDGKSLGRFGGPGKNLGQFAMPHMLCVDSQGRVYVAEVEGIGFRNLWRKREIDLTQTPTPPPPGSGTDFTDYTD